MKQISNTLFDTLAFFALTLTAFLLPIFFLSSPGVALVLSKQFILQFGVIATSLLWLGARLRGGSLSIPKSAILLGLFLVLLVSFVSALFSPHATESFLGSITSVDTFFSSLILFLFALLASILFQNEKRALFLYFAFVVSGLIFALYQVFRLMFGPDFLDFGIFSNAASNLLGKWNDMSLFFGFLGVMTLLSLQMLSLKPFAKITFYVALAASIFFLILTNFYLSWILIGLVALIVFVHGFFFGGKARTDDLDGDTFGGEESSGGMRIPVLPLVVFIVSLLFLIPGDFISTNIATQFGISQAEVRPSWSSTFDVAAETLKTDPVLGSGPNRFTNQWLLHKPDDVNQTIFWNTDFNFGIGLLPSFITTTGLAGTLAWLFFLLFFLYGGAKALLMNRDDKMQDFFVLSSFIFALYFWVASIWYVPSVVLFSFAFLFTGVFVAMLAREKTVGSFSLSFLKNPRLGFIAVLLLTIFLVAGFIGGYYTTQRYFAEKNFGKGLVALSQDGDVDQAESYLRRALELSEFDKYHRGMADIRINRLQGILSQTEGDAEALRAQFQEVLGGAIASARSATDYNPTNYLNWLTLGRVYESVVPLNIAGAYDNARSAYDRAAELNPKSPAIQLILGRNELAGGNTGTGKEFLEKAIELKPDYAQAIFALAQIAVQEGDINTAIRTTEQISAISPNNVGIFFQLGFLKYSNGDYQGAIQALERARRLSPQYSNAKYFLGLSYYQVGRNQEAISEFEDIQRLNPDNTEVAQVLENLRGGNAPFEGIIPPLEPPEEREELPLTDN